MSEMNYGPRRMIGNFVVHCPERENQSSHYPEVRIKAIGAEDNAFFSHNELKQLIRWLITKRPDLMPK